MNPNTVTYKGRTYRVGDDPRHQPVALPDWFPPGLGLGWRETYEKWGTSRVYGRVYRKEGEGLLVLASCATQADNQTWLHVSVSRLDRKIPTWEQMSQVKRHFIGDERTAYQVMPPKTKWVSIHAGCLHLWTCVDQDAYLPDFTANGETI